MVQVGFSMARLKVWQQWRRRYVSLYLRHVEASRMGTTLDAGFAAELAELETDLPVAVIMLFRSLAEQPLDQRNEGAEYGMMNTVLCSRGPMSTPKGHTQENVQYY